MLTLVLIYTNVGVLRTFKFYKSLIFNRFTIMFVFMFMTFLFYDICVLSNSVLKLFLWRRLDPHLTGPYRRVSFIVNSTLYFRIHSYWPSFNPHPPLVVSVFLFVHVSEISSGFFVSLDLKSKDSHPYLDLTLL